jgi:hypothetical protein
MRDLCGDDFDGSENGDCIMYDEGEVAGMEEIYGSTISLKKAGPAKMILLMGQLGS